MIVWSRKLAASAGILCFVAAATVASPAVADELDGYVVPKFTHEPYGDVHIVVPLTTDDHKIHAMKLRNMTNAIAAAAKWQGSADIKLVLFARGISLLRDPDENVKASIDFLRSHGVQILVCNNSLAENNLDFHTLYNVVEADIVPSGFLEVAYLQARKHYSVDPAN